MSWNKERFNRLYRLLAIVVVIFEFGVAITSFALIVSTKELRDVSDSNACNFSSSDTVVVLISIYVAFDVFISLICLTLFILCLKKITQNVEASIVQQRMAKVRFWSVIAMLTTLLSGMLTIIFEGSSPIFLIADIGM